MMEKLAMNKYFIQLIHQVQQTWVASLICSIERSREKVFFCSSQILCQSGEIFSVHEITGAEQL
jgi:hypothetical protein